MCWKCTENYFILLYLKDCYSVPLEALPEMRAAYYSFILMHFKMNVCFISQNWNLCQCWEQVCWLERLWQSSFPKESTPSWRVMSDFYLYSSAVGSQLSDCLHSKWEETFKIRSLLLKCFKLLSLNSNCSLLLLEATKCFIFAQNHILWFLNLWRHFYTYDDIFDSLSLFVYFKEFEWMSSSKICRGQV